MAEENQTVNTIFTGQADLAAAERQLEAFVKKWETGLGNVAKATSAIDVKMLKTIENFNKVMSVADRFQKTLEKTSMQGQNLAAGAESRRNIKGQAATIEGDVLEYRRRVSKALAGTVLQIDADLAKIDAQLSRMGTQRKKYAAEISNLSADRDRLTGSRSTIANNPFVAAELSGARSAKAKSDLRAMASDERAMQAASEQLVSTRIRLLKVETELAGLNAKAGGRAPARIKELRDERTQLEALARSYEGVGEVVRRASLNQGKILGKTLDTGRKDVLGQARQVLASEARIEEIKNRITLHETNQNTLNERQLQQLAAELKMTEKSVELHQRDVAVMERVTQLKERAAAAAAPKPTAAPNVTDSARRVLDIQAMTAKGEIEITRLKALGSAEDLKQVSLLQQELAVMATHQSNLMKIEGIESRITLERLRRQKIVENKGTDKDITDGAKRVLDNYNLIAKTQFEVNRLKATGTAEDAKQVSLLQAELRLLASQTVDLLKIEGIESRISLERVRRMKSERQPGPLNLTDSAKRVIDIQALVAKSEAEINRLKASGTQEDAKKVILLQQENAILNTQEASLLKREGIEGRITLERVRRQRIVENKGTDKDLTTAARQVLDIEALRIKTSAEINRLTQQNNAANARQISLLEAERQLLRSQSADLMRIEGIEGRITLERVRRRRDERPPAAVNLDRSANRVLDIQVMVAKVEAEIVRLKALGTAEDVKQANLAQGDLTRLAAEAAKLMQIEGIEGRITTQRLKRQKDEKTSVAGPHAPSADRLRIDGGVGILGVQSEVMANYAIISAMTQSAYALGTFVVQYEAALAQFQAIAAASNVETAMLSKTIVDLGQTTKFTNLEIAQTATVLAQAGLGARDTSAALASISTLAAAAGTELKQAADVVTSIASVWNVTTEEYGKIADVLTAALNRTKLGMDQIQLGIQYAANTAQDAGVGFLELTSALGAMANAGIRSGSTLGTGLRALIVDLETPTDKARAAYDRLGLTLSDTDVRTQGLTQVLANLKAKGFGASDAFNSFEIRAAAAYSALSNNVDVMVDLQGQLRDTGAAADANAVQMDTLAAKWTQFTNILKSSGNDAFAPVLVVFKEMTDLGTQTVGMLGSLGPVGQAAGVGVAVLVAALAVSKFIAATQAISAMATSIRLLPPALAAATGATQAFAVAEARATVATGMFSGALTFLNRVPVVLLIAGFAAIVTAVVSTIGIFNKAVDRTDELKNEINDLTSRMDETKKSIGDVDSTITKMSRTLSVLADHDIMRGQVLAEAKDKFQRLGLEIDDGSDSVEGMIEALTKLRTELQKEFSSELLLLANKLEERIRLMNLNLAEGKILTPAEEGKLNGIFAPVQTYSTGVQMAGGAKAAGLETSPRLAKYGQSAIKAYDYLTRAGSVQDASGTLNKGIDRNSLQKIQTDLLKVRQDLQNKIDLEKNPKKKAELSEELEQLIALSTGYDTLLKSLQSVLRAKDELDNNKSLRVYSDFMANPKANEAARLPDELRKALEPFFKEREGLKQKTLPAEETVKQMAEIAARASIVGDQQYQNAIYRSNQLPAGFSDKYLNDIAEQRNAAMADLSAWVDPLRAGAAKGARASGAAGQQSTNDDQSVERDLAAAKMKTLERDMADVETRLASATSGAQVELLRIRMTSLLALYEPLRKQQEIETQQAKGYYDRKGTVDVLAPAVMHQESRGDASAVSPVGALGLMQIMPGTARDIAKRLGRQDIASLSEELLKDKLLKDAALNEAFGREELRYLLDRYDGNTVLALAAYNAGPGRLDGFTNAKGKYVPGWLKTIGDPRKPGGPTSAEFAAKIPFAETKDYVAKIMARVGPTADGTQDPRFDTILAEGQAQAAADVNNKRVSFSKAARDKELAVEQAEIRRGQLEEQTRNEAQIKFLLENLSTVEGTMLDVAEAVSQVDALSRRNFELTEPAFWNDPKNTDRVGDPQAIRELAGILQQELIKGAQVKQDTLDAYIKARALAPDRAVATAQDASAKASATPGTSGTTLWALGERVDWEEYQAALAHQAAVEEAIALAMGLRADAQERLNEATILAQPYLEQMAAIEKELKDPATTAARREALLIQQTELEVMVAKAKAAVDLATTVKALQDGTLHQLLVDRREAAQGVREATPAVPIYEGNKTGNPAANINDPAGMITRAAAEFQKSGGLMLSVSDEIANGIQGTFDALSNGINKSITEMSNGSATIKGVFQNILGGILQSMQQTAAKIASDMIMKYLLNMIVSSFGVPSIPGAPAGGFSTGPSTGMGTMGAQGAIPRQLGGVIPRRMAGGGGVMNRDSVHILAEPGEVMMRKSAVQMVGKQNLLNINALGNRSLSQAGAAGATIVKKEPDKVNVWVVSPNQVPSAGPKDIVHYVAQDIAAGGTLKKLVRQVAMGG